MKTKILVIEDVPEMAELICMYLNNADFDSLAFDTAEKALEKLSAGYSPALVILDLNLPGMSGFDFLKTFRKNYKATIPVIIVSARDADEDIIEGLGFGADEFVTKPFSPKVLVARVQSKLARLCATEASVEETINFGPYTLYCNSKPATPEQVFNAVWKTPFGDMTAVGVYVQRLRRKIEEDPANPKYIKTVFGLGYQFSMENNEN